MATISKRSARGNIARKTSSRSARAAAIARADRGAYSRADRARILQGTADNGAVTA